MGVVHKLLKADGSRANRFQCSNGLPMDKGELVRLPYALAAWSKVALLHSYPLLPWWVRGSTEFVSTRIATDDVVLEDGAGMSSLWLASRCHVVTSVETRFEWRERVLKQATAISVSNLKVVHTNPPGAAVFKEIYSRSKPTVVVIDGVGDRLELLDFVTRHADRLSMIIYDNTDRPQDHASHHIMGNLPGWTSHVFRGLAPGQMHANETSVFVRDDAAR